MREKVVHDHPKTLRLRSRSGFIPALSATLSAGLGALCLMTAAPAQAAEAPAATAATASAPQPGPGSADHTMGSQIREHEANAPTRAAAAPGSDVVAPTSASAKAATTLAATSSVEGMDVSKWNGSVNWSSHYSAGRRFAWVKATEGTAYTSPTFAAQYNGSYSAGFTRGAYHFALPNASSGAKQATYFSAHGGGWSADGRTLPGVVDLEYNPYSGGDCYGLSKAKMAAWIKDFSTTYHQRWGKYPVIYTSASWWNLCVGSSTFAATNPLWVARYASSVGTLPTGWAYQTVWQYSSSSFDHDRFNGSTTQLKKLATAKD